MGRGVEWEGGSSGDVGSWEEKEKTAAVAARAAMAMQGGDVGRGMKSSRTKRGIGPSLHPKVLTESVQNPTVRRTSQR